MSSAGLAHQALMNQFEQDMRRYFISSNNLYDIRLTFSESNTTTNNIVNKGVKYEKVFNGYNARQKIVVTTKYTESDGTGNYKYNWNGSFHIYLYDLMELNGFTNPMSLGLDKKGYAFDNVPIITFEIDAEWSVGVWKPTVAWTVLYHLYDVAKAGYKVQDIRYKITPPQTNGSALHTYLTSFITETVKSLDDVDITRGGDPPLTLKHINMKNLFDGTHDWESYTPLSTETMIYEKITQRSHKRMAIMATWSSSDLYMVPLESDTYIEPAPIERLNRIRAVDSGAWVNVPTGNSEGEVVARKMRIPFNNIYGTMFGGNGFTQIYGAAVSNFEDTFPITNPGKIFDDYQTIHDYLLENAIVTADEYRSLNRLPSAFTQYFTVLVQMELDDVPLDRYSWAPFSDAMFSWDSLYNLAAVDLSLGSSAYMWEAQDTFLTYRSLTDGSFYDDPPTDSSYFVRMLGIDAGKVPLLLQLLKEEKILVYLRKLYAAFAAAMEQVGSLQGSVEMTDISKVIIQPMSSFKLRYSGATIDCIATEYDLTLNADGSFSANLGFLTRLW